MKIEPNDIDIVGEVSFRLPARAFRLDIALREPDRVSLALEYALKLLDVLDLAKPSEIGDFLGFSPSETDSLVMELIDSELAAATPGGRSRSLTLEGRLSMKKILS
ncbi:hypothetical protein [Primorskyibacter flagellatus]|uniref:Uncharacterized protein n=1 Tax=Primorskyibacter flagellatus TaxID=1387277 RepID=A0A1W2BVM1_9RHOB|nr:hypothetical protein [Primorskyibacter flagellatus]SMC76794.1 hypothetical protein SAMN06295998_10512 [Primorskyibacter flagellatus]